MPPHDENLAPEVAAEQAATPLYFDTDLGIDDALALAYLLASPEVALAGIGSVFGNLDSPRAARNVLDFLALAGQPDVPVAVGAQKPLADEFDGGAPHVHGDNGIGNITLERSSREPIGNDSAQLLIDLSHQYAGKLRVVAIGPLTNLAIALQRDPTLPERIEGLYLMGGAALVPGNITPVAEANIGHDPEAAAAVFGAQWPIVLAPLDVTMGQRLDGDVLDRMKASPSPVLAALGAMLDYYAALYEDVLGIREVPLHDPVAAGLATGRIVPSVAPQVSVEIETGRGPARGQTVADLRGMYRDYPAQAGAHVSVVLELSEPFAPHFLERIGLTG